MATNDKEIVNGIEVDIDKAQRLIKKVIVKEKKKSKYKGIWLCRDGKEN